MRILVLSASAGIPLYGPSGASAHLRGVARALRRAGHEVVVAVPRLADHRGAVDDPVGVPVVTSEPRKWGFIPRRWRERGERWDSRALVRAARGFRPDLIWERHSLFGDAGADQAARDGIPRLVEFNAPLRIERAAYETLLDPAFAERIEHGSLRQADRVLAVSSHLASWAVAVAGCDPARVRHVPNGVEDRGPGDREGTRRDLGLEGPVLGFVGTMKPWHGVHRLPELLDAVPEATAIVAGDGPVAVPAHPRLRALGRIPPDRLHHVVAAMDVGLAPYDTETPPWFCPLKMLEYLAQGVPVVAAPAGDCGWLLRGGGGQLVHARRPDVWAAAIRRQLAAPRVIRLRSWDTVVGDALDGLVG